MDHYKFVVNGVDSNGSEIKNVFYYKATADPTVPTMDTLITKFYTPLIAWYHEDFSISNVTWHKWAGDASGEWYETIGGKKVAKATPPWGIGYPITLTSDFVGQGTGDILPPQCAPYIYAKAPVAHVIAKKFFGPVVEAQNTNGTLGIVQQGVLDGVAAAWLTNVAPGAGAAEFTPEIWGPIHGFQQLIAAAAGTTFGTQRRRRRGVGA